MVKNLILLTCFYYSIILVRCKNSNDDYTQITKWRNNMSDPRSKPKTAKNKDSNAPHVLQAQSKASAKITPATQAAVTPQVSKKAARGR